MLELPAGGTQGPRLPPSPTQATPANGVGKLDPSYAGDRALEGGRTMVQPPAHISPVASSYRIWGSIGSVDLNLLVDTGAAVTLLREDMWREITPQPPHLEPWPGATLVSAGGMPLTVHGCGLI